MKALRGSSIGRRVRFAVGCSLGALCWPLAAEAQVTVGAQDQHISASPDTGIADSVVTAQRREEKLQNVPIAIAAVAGEELVKQGVTSTRDLGRSVPSLTSTNFAGYVLPRIRGIGNSVVGPGFESGVATYVDGVYMASVPLLSLNNIARIEVLKGPQGKIA